MKDIVTESGVNRDRANVILYTLVRRLTDEEIVAMLKRQGFKDADDEHFKASIRELRTRAEEFFKRTN
jgi:hypothetical protein